MMITKLTQIVDEARKRGRRRLAVAYGQDSHTLTAVYDAYEAGLVEPTVYGDKAAALDRLRREIGGQRKNGPDGCTQRLPGLSITISVSSSYAMR